MQRDVSLGLRIHLKSGRPQISKKQRFLDIWNPFKVILDKASEEKAGLVLLQPILR